jgi:excisionase family DNA binding protein
MGELSKQAAAEYLGCSARQVERLTAENKLGVRYDETARGKPVPYYDDGELARFKAEQDKKRTVHRPAVQVLAAREVRQEATTEDGTLSLPVASEEQMQVLAGHVLAVLLQRAAQSAPLMGSDGERQTEQGAPSLPVAPSKPQAMLGEKLTLSLDEATALSGVPRSMLRAAIQTGELAAKRIGRGFKVRREELERWVRETC